MSSPSTACRARDEHGANGVPSPLHFSPPQVKCFCFQSTLRITASGTVALGGMLAYCWGLWTKPREPKLFPGPGPGFDSEMTPP